MISIWLDIYLFVWENECEFEKCIIIKIEIFLILFVVWFRLLSKYHIEFVIKSAKKLYKYFIFQLNNNFNNISICRNFNIIYCIWQ